MPVCPQQSCRFKAEGLLTLLPGYATPLASVLPHEQYRDNVRLAVFQHVPLMVLAVGIGRYFYARAEMFKSADGAALAAVHEVDVRAYLNIGQMVLLLLAYGPSQPRAVSVLSTLRTTIAGGRDCENPTKR